MVELKNSGSEQPDGGERVIAYPDEARMSGIYVNASCAIANSIVSDGNIRGEPTNVDGIAGTSHRRFYVPNFIVSDVHVLSSADINRVRMFPPGQ